MDRPRLALILFLALPAMPGAAQQFPDPLETLQQRVWRAIEKARPAVATLEFQRPSIRGPRRISLSGVFVRKEGILLTLAEPLGETASGDVVLADGSRRTGRVEAVDPETRLALVHVSGDAFAVPDPAPEDRIRPGLFVVTLGGALGRAGTVGTGVVSGVDRAVGLGGQSVTGLIQITAPVNPGDAGGLVADLDGRMVGMIFSTYDEDPEDPASPPTDAVEGVHFALPARKVLAAADRLLTKDPVPEPGLGLSVRPVPPELRAHLGLTPDIGLVVLDVREDGPAGKAGVQSADVLVRIDGSPVKGEEAIRVGPVNLPAGTHKLVVVRKGQETELTLIQGEETKPKGR